MADQSSIDASYELETLKSEVQQLKEWKDRVMRNGLKDLYARAGQMRFGGNVMRLDANGIQLVADAAGTGIIWFVPDGFRTDPNSVFPYGVIIAFEDSVADSSEIDITAAANGVQSGLQVYNSLAGGRYVAISNCGLGLYNTASDLIASPGDGMVWYRSDSDKFRGRANSTIDNFAMEAWVTANFLGIGASSGVSIGLDLALQTGWGEF